MVSIIIPNDNLLYIYVYIYIFVRTPSIVTVISGLICDGIELLFELYGVKQDGIE